MNSTAWRQILFVTLTTVMCFSFSGYILLSSYQINTTIGLNTLSEEEQGLGEKSIIELNSFYLQERNLLIGTITLSSESSFPYIQSQLPLMDLSPNTPPPDLA